MTNDSDIANTNLGPRFGQICLDWDMLKYVVVAGLLFSTIGLELIWPDLNLQIGLERGREPVNFFFPRFWLGRNPIVFPLLCEKERWSLWFHQRRAMADCSLTEMLLLFDVDGDNGDNGGGWWACSSMSAKRMMAQQWHNEGQVCFAPLSSSSLSSDWSSFSLLFLLFYCLFGMG